MQAHHQRREEASGYLGTGYQGADAQHQIVHLIRAPVAHRLSLNKAVMKTTKSSHACPLPSTSHFPVNATACTVPAGPALSGALSALLSALLAQLHTGWVRALMPRSKLSGAFPRQGVYELFSA